TEEDVIAGKLGGAKLLIAVGDHWPTAMVTALEKWVKAGGTVLATADAGMYDEYHRPSPAWRKLAGAAKAVPAEEATFLRPPLGLPRTEVLGKVVGDGWKMPAVGTAGSLPPDEGTKVLAKYETGQPALTERTVGKGKVVWIGCHPGMSYLYTALQPPTAPD